MTEGTDWYQGTADAVRKNLRYLTQPGIDYVRDPFGRSALSDGLRRDAHDPSRGRCRCHDCRQAGARSRGRGAGDHASRRLGTRYRLSRKTANRSRIGSTSAPTLPGSTRQGIASHGRDCLASMGIYLFNRNDAGRSVGKHRPPRFWQRSLPASIATRKSNSICSTATGKTSARSVRFTRPTCSWPIRVPPFELITSASPHLFAASVSATHPGRWLRRLRIA